MWKETYYLSQYKAQSPLAQQAIDILSVYLYPIDVFTLRDAMMQIQSIEQLEVNALLDHLESAKLGTFTVSGNFMLQPALSFLLFPQNIQHETYQKIIQRPGQRTPSFYSSGAILQTIQQLLIAYFIGDQQLLSPPVRRVESELAQYAPYLFYLLYDKRYYHLLERFTESSMEAIVEVGVMENLLALQPLKEISAFLKKSEQLVSAQVNAPMLIWLLKGNFSPLEHQLSTSEPQAFVHFLQGVVKLYSEGAEASQQAFEQGMKLQRKADKKSLLPNHPLFAFYYVYALTLLPVDKVQPVLQKLLSPFEKKVAPVFVPAVAFIYYHFGKKERAENLLLILVENNANLEQAHLLSVLAFCCLQTFHPKSKVLKLFESYFKVLLKECFQHEYILLLFEALYAARESHVFGDTKRYEQLKSTLPYLPALARMAHAPEWERLLNTLLLPASEQKQQKAPVVINRVAYLIDTETYKVIAVQQSALGEGMWTSGKTIPLRKLKEGKVEGMTEQDKRIGQAVMRESHFSDFQREGYEFEDTVWEALVGHPHLYFMESPQIGLEIVKGGVELIVNKTPAGFTFTANVHDYTKPITLVPETPTRFRLIRISSQQKMYLQTILQIPLVPFEGKEKLQVVLQQVSSEITVHSDVENSSQVFEQRESDSRVWIQLVPVGDVLRATLYVKPFGKYPPYCKPGLGATNVMSIINNVRCQAARDLEKETSNYQQLLELLQSNIQQEIDDDNIVFEDPADCLHLLEIIHLHPQLVVAEWPDGERFKLRSQVGFTSMRLSLKVVDHWFECKGDVKIDEQLMLSLQEMLDLVKVRKDKFVLLSTGEYIVLTNEFRKRLLELGSIVYKDKNGVRLPQLAAHMVADMIDGAGDVKVDPAWYSIMQQREQLAALPIEVPNTLETTLRPYQEEGFRWMVRLSELGAGACLADDMGLGKTVQTIALLLHRAKLGASLVVCPASVLPNWLQELQRFAPTLNVIQFNSSEPYTAFSPFDVVVTTYNLMQTNDEQFAQIQWSNAVLDEAHTIKNYQTKTSKAAMNLQADFKLILTGTPIQNHVGEIWNLFNFINPGLLGTLKHFHENFAMPMSKFPMGAVKDHLRKLISPYMLRRTKVAVMEELPGKTEIEKVVMLSREERAFYEGIRRRAVEQIKLSAQQKNRLHLQTLAEINRLRMAACNPKLLDEQVDIDSTKMRILLEIVEELIPNRHRALIFSQFVKHLALVKKALDSLGIPYLYLDGSTPIAERGELVQRFQGGEAPLFLISLKAGGQGLNLTAADFVIHLDPWWNPAIEEQASDRAYRIGQTRPVTVYRLVAKDTIEEKIMQLHVNKRDIADHLLAGSDQAAKLSSDELLDLISL
ncbi:SNF2 family DNA or RNA helicase [Chitinophaga skermanii]|uniref:SNF2 family DNA or RNA helicase n=1 Tax=Chitinophaga skermanii TaxID=331697 RepID=A0A327QFE9_9BACT|nr:DEAD/DEAH box helicase [Chitinophaga skermanii]RAJ00407.1 SNF2 family DNA or RNA helicase [Chitinophaga skermanii]